MPRVLIYFLMLAASMAPQVLRADEPPIPELATWKSQMITFGRQHCDKSRIKQDGTGNEDGVWYYDGTRIFYQIADYTADPFWGTCAGYVRDVYRPHAIAGHVGGWRVFSHGMYMDYQRQHDPKSLEAVKALATTSAFAWSGGGSGWPLSRETAYLLSAYIRAKAVGLQTPKLAQSFEWALGHLDQWFVSQSAPIVKPFMVGLTAEALIDYYENVSHDPRIVTGLTTAAGWLWDNAWSESTQAFQYGVCRSIKYQNECNQGPTADLNLLIAPMYAWLYHRTGNPRFMKEGDEIFAGGVRGSWLGHGKQFSQNYRWSFDYVRWRSVTPLKHA